VIGSIRHKGLRRLFEAGDGKSLRADMVPRLRRMLSAIHAAEELAELESVSRWRLHPLKGSLKGLWSLSVSGNWRLVFKWNKGAATDIDLVDYH
jgi:proteic killer suppression protein